MAYFAVWSIWLLGVDMNWEWITNNIIFAAAAIGFIYGIFRILIRKKPLFMKLPVMSLGCLSISFLYFIMQYLTRGEVPNGFNVGLFGLTGCFMFLFSCNYGQMDSLADDGNSALTKYRLLSWIPIPILICIFVPVYLCGTPIVIIVGYSVVMLFLVNAARFHFKHLIWPDVNYGVVRCIRGYNLTALILCFATAVLLVAEYIGNEYLYLGAGIVMSVCCIAVLPIIEMGEKRWKECSRWTR